MKMGHEKALIKTLLGKDFPESFLNRPKLGFGSPVTMWMKDPKIRKIIKETIVEQQASMLAIWKKPYYSRILKQLDRGSKLPYTMWLHYVLCTWLRNNDIAIS